MEDKVYKLLLNDLLYEEPKGFIGISNEEIADEFLKEVHKYYPEAFYLKDGVGYHIAVNDEGKRFMLNSFIKKKNILEGQVKETSNLIKQINDMLQQKN